MKEKELKRLEDIESKIMELESELSVVYKRISEPLAFILVDPKGGETSRKPYERELREPIITNTSNEPLDLTKILEVGDEVESDHGVLVVQPIEPSTERGGFITAVSKSDGKSYMYKRNGWGRQPYCNDEEQIRPKNGKTWAQFIAEKEEKKQQIPTLEKAIEDIKKGLEKFDDPEFEVHMTLKKLKSGGYAPSKIHLTNR